MYLHMIFNSSTNMLLVNSTLVGMNEIVEIYSPDNDSPPQACGKLLRKVAEPDTFIANSEDDVATAKTYILGEKCILRIMMKNLSGTRRRKFSDAEKEIVSMERNDAVAEHKVVRAKTGSIRKQKKKYPLVGKTRKMSKSGHSAVERMLT